VEYYRKAFNSIKEEVESLQKEGVPKKFYQEPSKEEKDVISLVGKSYYDKEGNYTGPKTSDEAIDEWAGGIESLKKILQEQHGISTRLDTSATDYHTQELRLFSTKTGKELDRAQIPFESLRYVDALGLLRERTNATLKKSVGVERFFQAGSEEERPFYSRLTRTVEQSQQGKASGAQWKAMLRNKQLNADEMSLIGLDDLFPDNEILTKQQAVERLKASEIQVKDVTLGEGISTTTGYRVERSFETRDPSNQTWDVYDKDNNFITAGLSEAGAWEALRHNIRRSRQRLKTLQDRWKDEGELPPGEREELASLVKRDITYPVDPTHFSTYQLPGAKEGSYREVLLTVPVLGMRAENYPEFMSLVDFARERGIGADEALRAWSQAGGVESPLRKEYIAARDGHYENVKPWRDGHSQYSDIANPIVRLRFNERTTADGKRMLFLEEIQAPLKGEFEKMPPLFQKNWREVAFKWALRHAVENGFDSVGWTTGEQQAARYDLSKQVDRIQWFKTGPDTYDISAWKEEAFRTDGRPLIDLRGQKSEELEGVIGKDIAKQVIESTDESGSFTGESLKIGGEGLKKLYDVDFRNVVNNIPAVKKAGQKVGESYFDGSGGKGLANDDVASGAAVGAIPVHSLAITPQIRESVMGGQAFFQSATTERPRFGIESLPQPKARKSPLTWTEQLQEKTVLGVNPKVRQTLGEAGEVHADAFDRFLSYNRRNIAVSLTPMERLLDKVSTNDANAAYHIAIRERYDSASYTDELANPDQRAVYKLVKKILNERADNQIAAGQKIKDWIFNKETGKAEVIFRDLEKEAYYFPTIESAKVYDIIHNQPNHPLYEPLKEAFVDSKAKSYKSGDIADRISRAESEFADMLAQKAKGTGADKTFFGPTRLAEGTPLPPSWIEPDFRTAWRRYTFKHSRDRAFFDAFEGPKSDPRAIGLLGYTRQYDGSSLRTHSLSDGTKLPNISSNPLVRAELDYMTGKASRNFQQFESFTGFVNSMILGPVSSATDTISTFFSPLKYTRNVVEAGKMYIDALQNFKERGWKPSFETGFNQQDSVGLKELFDANNVAAQNWSNLRRLFQRYQGRQLMEQVNRAGAQTFSDFLVRARIADHNIAVRAGKPNLKVDSFLRGLVQGELPNIGKTELSLSPEQISEYATRLAEEIQGKYNPSGLPLWALQGGAAPFVRLARWNIEMTNVFLDRILKPAQKYVKTGGKEGDITPLIMSTLGSIAGGALIKEMREAVTNRESPVPSFAEILNADTESEEKIPTIAYQLVSMMAYTGYAGLFSDLAKSVGDIAYKNNPVGFSNTAYEFLADTSTKLAQGTSALLNGEPFVDVGTQLTSDLLRGHVQVARVGLNWLESSGALGEQRSTQQETGKEIGRMRRYNIVEGLPYAQQGRGEGRYENLQEKKFKREVVPERIVSDIGPLVNKLVEKYQDNPEVLESKLKGLKTGAVKTMPDPEKQPIEFSRYIEYTRKTYGDEAVNNLMKNWLERRSLRQFRNQLVPSF
jgi:hypothetical protein